MRRRATKNTRAPDSEERAFMAWTKEQPCICCGNEPVIVDHIYGSTKKVYVGPERVLIGHWAVLPLCQSCDDIKTKGSRRKFKALRGNPIELWSRHSQSYHIDIPINVISGILRSGN